MKYSMYKYSSSAKNIKAKLVGLSSVMTLAFTGFIMSVMPLSAGAATSAVYNNIPSPLPGNLASEAFQATQTSEFGGQVQLSGSNRTDPTVSVVMSSWACQTGHWTSGCTTTPGSSFSHPITLNVYAVNADNTPGSLIRSTTQTFAIPFRPSTNTAVCGDNRWSSDGTNANCFNGFANQISFNLSGTTLPNKVIIAVAFNTSGYGSTPLGYDAACYATVAGCGYDSLNVGLADSLTVGTQPLPNDAYLNSATGAQYCTSDQTTTGTFRLDTGCWTGYQPAIKVQAQAAIIPLPTNTEQCKKDGWKNYGTTFKNQGDCVSFIATKAKNQPSGLLVQF